MSAFEIPFRRTFAWLRAFLIPAARFGVRGAIILYGAVLLVTGIWLSWFGDGPPPVPGSGLSLSVMELPQEALDRALTAHATHAGSLLDRPGVVAAGVGLDATGRPALKVYVTEAAVLGLPATLDGVPVTLDVVGEIWALQDAPATLCPDCGDARDEPADAKPASRFERPVPIGVSAGHPSITAGTIGARVTDGSKVFALSNNHVFAAENRANINDHVLQPGPVDGGVNPADAIGTLVDYEPVEFSFGSSNTMDAAIALSTTENLGNSTPAEGYGTPRSETVSPKIGLKVQKMGRTTGHTHGSIDAIMATVNVRYHQGQARFVNQILIKPGSFSAGGDSGSLVVAEGGSDDKKPVGLVFAGSTLVSIANPIDPILERFGVTIDGSD